MNIPHKDDFRGAYWTNHKNERVPGSLDIYSYCRALEKYAVEMTLKAAKREDEE